MNIAPSFNLKGNCDLVTDRRVRRATINPPIGCLEYRLSAESSIELNIPPKGGTPNGCEPRFA